MFKGAHVSCVEWGSIQSKTNTLPCRLDRITETEVIRSTGPSATYQRRLGQAMSEASVKSYIKYIRGVWDWVRVMSEADVADSTDVFVLQILKRMLYDSCLFLAMIFLTQPVQIAVFILR